jgi:hypothetical protein
MPGLGVSMIARGRPEGVGRAIHFVRHLAEMVVAMMLGMFAFGLVLAAAGTDLVAFRLSHPELSLMAMATAMSVPMVGWMRHRGHTWSSGAEMTVAMFVPVAIIIPCYWLSAMSAEPMCPIACAAMIPAMAVAMLFRRDEYTTHVKVVARAAPAAGPRA